VVFQNAEQGRYKCQFTFACDGRSDYGTEQGAWKRASKMAQVAFREFQKGDTPGVVFVDVDNPRLWTRGSLYAVDTQWNGKMPEELAVASYGWKCSNCDLSLDVDGGDGPPASGFPFANGVSGGNASIADSLMPWTNAPGHWSAQGQNEVTVVVNGLRVGAKPIDTQLNLTLPSGTKTIDAFPAQIALDPSVLLVPVQVVVFSNEKFPAPPQWDLANQLMLWDRVPSNDSVWIAHDGSYGELTYVERTMDRFLYGGENGPGSVRANGRYIPDDVWATCGIHRGTTRGA
jgi:hypothetical protein